MAEKYVYFFGNGFAEGNAKMRDILGGKGANLAEMTNLGLPVPPGFTISTKACIYYYKNNKKYPEGLEEEILENMRKLEEVTGKKFGSIENPLLVSVRSGAAISMPGMMDTILNLGLNEDTIKGLIKKTQDEKFAYDAYRRFIQMFGNVVLGIAQEKFEQKIEEKKKTRGAKQDIQLSAEDFKQLVEEFKEVIKKEKRIEFPTQPFEQLKMAEMAVFESWNNKRAITYRNLHNIPHDLGTAVNVQTMVFGNMKEDSGTGVAFTRDPATGENKFYGEYLMRAQGEDVVAGIRTPKNIEDLEKEMPKIYKQLVEIRNKLESHYKEMQDIEFTIEEGELFMLQTRTGKRTAQAAVNIAVDMVSEGLITKEEAVLRIQPSQIDHLLHPMIDPSEKVKVIAKGLPASPGACSGMVVFNSDEAVQLAEGGEKVILVRKETSPEDIQGMASSQGILTSRGGMTSHAAVVGRGMGKTCIVGCEEITIDEEARKFKVKNIEVKYGDYISLNGTSGEVILGRVKLLPPQLTDKFKKLMQWADQFRKLGVRANADTPKDARIAKEFGAEGIGLCRTEHMFFGEERLPLVRQMILATNKKDRAVALEKLLPLQKNDFKGIFEVMQELPVTIRLLDPPLHEFLPREEEEIKKVAKQIGISEQELRDKVNALREFNPMLGHRGCRLGITFPEIYKMQVKAILTAQAESLKEGKPANPEIMIPLVGEVREIKTIKTSISEVAASVTEELDMELKYSIGTMIEVPRACITSSEIAKEVEFYSFGTNDLTQMTFGFSRDDIAKFLPYYLDKKILDNDPFITIDRNGVGELLKFGINQARKVNSKLKIGICGEHGGDPDSIEFCEQAGLDYVSCSPFRVPVARLTAAQIALRQKSEDRNQKAEIRREKTEVRG